jgi:hypothetical protein
MHGLIPGNIRKERSSETLCFSHLSRSFHPGKKLPGNDARRIHLRKSKCVVEDSLQQAAGNALAPGFKVMSKSLNGVFMDKR